MSSDAPKGFDKYFKPPKSSSSSSENEEIKSDKAETPKKAPSASKSTSDSKPPPDWNFGMFGPQHGPKSNSSGSKGGRPIGGEQNPDQNKMLLYGGLGITAFIIALTFFELGYKEISWKDFINKYVKTL